MNGSEELFRLVTEAKELRTQVSIVFFDITPNAVLVVDRDGVIADCNNKAEFLTGYHHTELLGKSVEMLVPEKSRMKHIDFRAMFNEDPRPRPMGSNLNLRMLNKQGVEIAVKITLSPVMLPQGLFTVVLILNRGD